jgi:hypothetical protein
VTNEGQMGERTGKQTDGLGEEVRACIEAGVGRWHVAYTDMSRLSVLAELVVQTTCV